MPRPTQPPDPDDFWGPHHRDDTTPPSTPTPPALDTLIAGYGDARRREQTLRAQPPAPDTAPEPEGGEQDHHEALLRQVDYLEGLHAVQARLLEADLDDELRPTADPERRAWQRQQVEIHAREVLASLVPGVTVNPAAREKLIAQWVDDIAGLGPAEPLYQDPAVTEVVILGPERAMVERDGQLDDVAIGFRGQDHLIAVAQRLAVRIGRKIDEADPMVDTRLPDGTRVNIVFPPVALDGVVITIRRHPPEGFRLDELRATGMLTTQMADLLRVLVRSGVNLVISGATNAGKTTLLKALAAEIPDNEYVVTIEDLAELSLGASHWRTASLEARMPDSTGRGEVPVRKLLRNALRMRPDRIIVGEVRNEEALDMLAAMNTGHEGSMTTLHANSVGDAVLRRIPNMATQAGEVTLDAACRDTIEVIEAGIHLRRINPSGRRIIDTITAVQASPSEPGTAHIEHLYQWDHARGDWVAHSVIAPRLNAKIEAAGANLTGPLTPPPPPPPAPWEIADRLPPASRTDRSDAHTDHAPGTAQQETST